MTTNTNIDDHARAWLASVRARLARECCQMMSFRQEPPAG